MVQRGGKESAALMKEDQEDSIVMMSSEQFPFVSVIHGAAMNKNS